MRNKTRTGLPEPEMNAQMLTYHWRCRGETLVLPAGGHKGGHASPGALAYCEQAHRGKRFDRGMMRALRVQRIASIRASRRYFNNARVLSRDFQF